MAFRQQPGTQNGFSITMDKVQLDALQSMLKKLPGNIGVNALRAAMKTALKTTENRSAALLGEFSRVDTGRLRRNVKARMRRTSRYGKGFVKGTVGVKSGKSRKDPNGAFYAPFIEFGHKITTRHKAFSGKSVAAAPFLSEGLRKTTRINVLEFATNVRAEIDKRVKRLPKSKLKGLDL